MDTVNLENLVDSSFEELLSSTEREPTTVNSVNVEEQPTESKEDTIEVEPFIKPNSGSELVTETTTRFSSAIWYRKIQSLRILVAGIGGIGSYVTFLIARMRPMELLIIDPDTVEAVNMAGQLYGSSDIGSSKVRAMYKRVLDLCGYSLSMVHNRFESTEYAKPIMICGFDNMLARRAFYFAWKEYTDRRVEADANDSRQNYLFLDGRIKC